MENACIITYNQTNVDQRDLILWDDDLTKNFETTFRPLQLIDNYDPYFEDPQYGRDPYWDEEIYDQEKLDFYTNYTSESEVEPDDWETDRKIKPFFTYVTIDLWSPNPQPQSPLAINSRTQRTISEPLIDETIFSHIAVHSGPNGHYVPLSTNLELKSKRRMLYFPMDFGELTIDALIDTGALSSAIPQSDLRKI